MQLNTKKGKACWKKNRDFVRSGILAVGIKFCSAALSFWFFLELASFLNEENYGVFASSFSLALIVGFLATNGQDIVVLRFWPSFEEKYGREAATLIIRFGLCRVAIGSALISVSMYFLSYLIVTNESFNTIKYQLPLIGLFASVFAFSEFSTNAIRARGWILLALLPREIVWRILAIAMLYVYFWSVDSYTSTANLILLFTIIALLIVTLPQIVILVRDAFLTMGMQKKLPELDEVKFATRGLWASGILGPILNFSPTAIVGVTLGPVEAGTYFAADRIAKLLSLPLIGINQIAAPILAGSYQSGDIHKLKFTYLGSALFSGIASLLGLIIVYFTGGFALTLFSNSYTTAFSSLLILAAGQVVNSICGPNGLLLNMSGRERQFLFVMAVWSILTVLSVYFCSLSFGLMGAAVATVMCVAGWNITAVILCKPIIFPKEKS